jgi:hypothetical protein
VKLHGWPALPLAFLTSFLSFVAVFVLPPPWLLRRSLALRHVFLARPWRLRILLPGTSLLRRSLLSPLRRRWRSYYCMLLIMLPHYRVTRLVTVTLAVKRLLLLHSGIPIP